MPKATGEKLLHKQINDNIMLLIIPGLAELAYHTVTTMPGLTNLRDLTGKYKTRQVEIKELCSTIIIETQSLT